MCTSNTVNVPVLYCGHGSENLQYITVADIALAIASWLTFPVAHWTNRYFRLTLGVSDPLQTFAFHTLNIHTQHYEQHIYTYTGTHKDIQTLLNDVTLKLSLPHQL